MAEDGLTRAQIKEIVEDPDFNIAEMRELLIEEFQVELPPDLTVDQIVEFVFEVYQKKAAEVSQVRRERRADAKRSKTEGKSREAGGVSRAAFISAFIKDAKETTRAEVEKATDEAYAYGLAGRKPKTRVNRVIRNLTRDGKIEVTGQKIRWIG